MFIRALKWTAVVLLVLPLLVIGGGQLLPAGTDFCYRLDADRTLRFVRLSNAEIGIHVNSNNIPRFVLIGYVAAGVEFRDPNMWCSF